jgi:hypothetical protein
LDGKIYLNIKKQDLTLPLDPGLKSDLSAILSLYLSFKTKSPFPFWKQALILAKKSGLIFSHPHLEDEVI